MFSFFKKKVVKPYIDFSVIGTDIHSHLIPGIDDGSDSLETSVEMIKQMQALGIRKIITTPHVMSEVYDNGRENILGGLKKLQDILADENINISVHAAAEYYLDESFLKLLHKEPLLTFGDNYVLVELSFFSPPNGLFNYFFELGLKGYKVILAHPERYGYFHKSYTEYHEIREKGVFLQLNALSLTGYYGESTKKIAFKLIEDQLIDFIGTDAHHFKHLERLKDQMKNTDFQRVFSNYAFKNATIC